jgi:hypothetical protein
LVAIAGALFAAGARAAEERTVTVFAQSGAAGYLSDAQTAAGIGGGVGARAVFDRRWLVQADISYLAMIGHVGLARIGAGWQRDGAWRPAALVTASAFFGDRLRFLPEGRAEPVSVPALSLGVLLAPVRFAAHGTEVSVLEVGAGAGWDVPGAGFSVSVTLLQVGVALP